MGGIYHLPITCSYQRGKVLGELEIASRPPNCSWSVPLAPTQGGIRIAISNPTPPGSLPLRQVRQVDAESIVLTLAFWNGGFGNEQV